MKKTEAIRRARGAVPQPRSAHPPEFVVSMPSDVSRPDSERVEVIAKDYLDAQHIRSYCIARIALALMGLGHVPLTRQDGGTIDQLMDKAIARAERGDDAVEPMGFWQVRLDCAPVDDDEDVEAPASNARQA